MHDRETQGSHSQNHDAVTTFYSGASFQATAGCTNGDEVCLLIAQCMSGQFLLGCFVYGAESYSSIKGILVDECQGFFVCMGETKTRNILCHHDVDIPYFHLIFYYKYVYSDVLPH